MHRVEAVRGTEEVGWRLGRAADAGQLGDTMRGQFELKTGANDCGTDRIVATTGAQCGNRALIVTPGVAEAVLMQFRMVKLWLGEEGHHTAFLVSAAMLPAMKRALIGVPS